MIFDWPREPAWAPMAGRFYLTNLGRKSSSPYTGAIKAINLNKVWMAELVFNNHSLEQAQAIQAFVEGLEGAANPVRLFDYWRRYLSLYQPSAFSDGTFFTDGTGFIDSIVPLVQSAAPKGATSVLLGSMPINSRVMVKGDLIGIGGYLYQVMADVSTNGSGQALVQIAPGLRIGCATSDAVSVSYATLPMRLVEGGEGIVRNFNTTEGFTLSFVEDVP